MGLTEEQYQSAIVRILGRQDPDYVWGTGFLIAPRYVLTCAHVVQDASGLAASELQTDLEVRLDFPHAKLKPPPAKLVWVKPCLNFQNPQWGEDLALLELSAAVSLEPLPLIANSIKEEGVKIWGFPEDYENLGDWAKGQILGFQTQGWLQLESEQPITGGFSGAPMWSLSLQGVIGMVTESDKNHDYRKASAISAPVLKEMVGRYCSLLEIVRSLPTTTIQTAYQKSRPDKCAAAVPTNLLEQLQELGGMGQGEHSCDRLVEFCARLVVSSELSPAQKRQLRQWVKSEFEIDSEVFEEVCDRLSQPVSDSAEPILLILVTPQKQQENRYNIQASYICDARSYDPRQDRGHEPLSVEQGESLRPDELIVQMPAMLRDLLNQTVELGGNLDEPLKVEFFLPIRLINQGFEQCFLYEFADEQRVLGQDYVVLVRLWERLGYELQPFIHKKFKRNWKTRWTVLQQCIRESSAGKLTCGDRTLSEIAQDLKQQSSIGIKITKGFTTEHHKVFEALLMRGIPVALWLRKQFAECSCADTLNTLLSGTLQSLPENLMDARDSASHHEPEHLSHHLSLLWDDPQKIPPETRLTSRRL